MQAAGATETFFLVIGFGSTLSRRVTSDQHEEESECFQVLRSAYADEEIRSHL